MMAFGFSEDYFRIVNQTSSRIGYKISEIMAMQIGEPIVFIPCRDMVIEPIKKAYDFTLSFPTGDLVGQAIDLYSENCRMLGVVYIVADNRVRLIYSRVTEKVIEIGKLPTLDVIRFLDFELSAYERFTYTFITLNRWNFCNIRMIQDIGREEFEEMFKCSSSTMNGSGQTLIDLNAFKAASVTMNRDAKICHGRITEEQLFYDLDMDSGLTQYAVVRTDNDQCAVPAMILREFLSDVPVVHEPRKVKKHKLVLHV